METPEQSRLLEQKLPDVPTMMIRFLLPSSVTMILRRKEGWPSVREVLRVREVPRLLFSVGVDAYKSPS